MVKDHSDSKRGNPLPPHGLLFPMNSKGSFILHPHRQDSTYHGLCYTSRGALAFKDKVILSVSSTWISKIRVTVIIKQSSYF